MASIQLWQTFSGDAGLARGKGGSGAARRMAAAARRRSSGTSALEGPVDMDGVEEERQGSNQPKEPGDLEAQASCQVDLGWEQGRVAQTLQDLLRPCS